MRRMDKKVMALTLLGAILALPVFLQAATPPVAQDWSMTVPEASTNACVLGYVLNTGAPGTTFKLMSAPRHGTLLTLTPAGGVPVPAGRALTNNQWYYAAPAGYRGADRFTWKVNDGISDSAAATHTLNITGNTAPVASTPSVMVPRGGCVAVGLCADPDAGQALVSTLVTAPAHGTLRYRDPAGLYRPVSAGVPVPGTQWVYKADAVYTGADIFAWTTSDGVAVSHTGVCSVTSTVNIPPAVNNSVAGGVQGNVAYLNFPHLSYEGAFRDPSEPAFNQFTVLEGPANGKLEYSDTNGVFQVATIGVPFYGNTFRFRPNPGFASSDTILWRVNDGMTTSAVASAKVVVNGKGAVTVDNQSLVTAAGSVRRFVPLSYQNGSAMMAFFLVTPPAHGVLECSTGSGHQSVLPRSPVSSSSWYYTPAPGFRGTDSFVWQVCDGLTTSGAATVSISVEGNTPPAASSQSVTTVAPGMISLESFDPDDYQVRAYTLITAPTRGTLKYAAAGNDYRALPVGSAVPVSKWLYSPNMPGYTGTDSFAWTVSDGVVTSESAICTLAVVSNSAPVVENQYLGTKANLPLTLSFSCEHAALDANSGQRLMFTLVTPPRNGKLVRWDSVAMVSVSAGVPQSLEPNVFSYFYVPNSGFTGEDSFVWQMFDGVDASGLATCSVRVSNTAPEAYNGNNTVSGGSARNVIALSGADADGSRQPHFFTLETLPANGVLSVLYMGADIGSGILMPARAGVPLQTMALCYTPNPGFAGRDFFTWTVNDGVATSGTATNMITVIPVAAPHTQPVFKAGVKLQNGGQTLQVYRNVDPTSGLYIYGNPAATVNAMAAPEVVDWNNDGLQDLLVGQADGRVALFLNKGTRGNPVFEGFTYLKLRDGTYIWGFAGCNCDGGGPACTAPRVVDWNNDGKKDLLLGQWAGPFFNQPMYVCLNVGTDENPVFSERLNCLMATTATLQQPYTMPCVADWNGDGILDLISGDNSMWGPVPNYLGYPSLKAPSGAINVWLGTSNNHGPGTVLPNFQKIPTYNAAGSFASALPSITITGACPVMSRKSVVLTDWTGSGIKDLVIGTQDGAVWYAPNLGTVNYPVFTNYYPVMAGGTNVVVGNRAYVGRDPWYDPSVNSVLSGQHMPYVNEARIAVADLDGDGLQDLLVGDVSGTVTFYAQYNPNPVAIDRRVRVIRNTPTPVTLASRVDSGHAVTATVTSRPEHGALSGSGTNWVYTPKNATFTGTDSFTFVVADGALVSRTGTVTLLVNSLPPVAASQVGHDTALVLMNSSRTVTLAATDPGNAPLTYSVVTRPAHGGVVIASNTATYTPAAGYTGPDSFTFKANDGVLDSSPATVALEVVVLAVNFQPSGRPVPAGYVKDDGSVFDAGRGYGWDSSCTNAMVWRDRHPDARLDTLVSLSATTATWRCSLPNGNYFVTLSCGDPGNDLCGPHQVSVQGGAPLSKKQKGGCPTAIAGSFMRDQYLRFDNIPAAVTNGRLSVAVGDGTNTTCLDYLEIRKAAKVSGTAMFVGEDATTQGAWKGVYGSEGRWMINSYIFVPDNFAFNLAFWTRNIPSYAWFFDPFVYEQSWVVWTNSTSDPRALQNAWDNGRAASSLIGSKYTTEQVGRLTFLDGATHRVALYCLDWDGNNTLSQTIDILDAGDNVLDSRTVSAFTGGKYLVWDLSGDVKIRLPGRGRLAAIFFGVGAGSSGTGSAPMGK